MKCFIPNEKASEMMSFGPGQIKASKSFENSPTIRFFRQEQFSFIILSSSPPEKIGNFVFALAM